LTVVVATSCAMVRLDFVSLGRVSSSDRFELVSQAVACVRVTYDVLTQSAHCTVLTALDLVLCVQVALPNKLLVGSTRRGRNFRPN